MTTYRVDLFLSVAPQPASPESTVSAPSEDARKKRAKLRRGPFTFLLGSVLIFTIVIEILLVYLAPSWIDVLPVAVGVILWRTGLRRTRTITEKRTYFAYTSIIAAVLGYLAYNSRLGFYGASQFASGLGVFFLLFSPISGLVGVLSSHASERRRGLFLVVGPGLGLLVWGVIDAPIFWVPILWWGVPFAFGLATLTKMKARITSKGLALMGFASLLLPWFTTLQSNCCGYADETTSSFLTDFILLGTSVLGVRPLPYDVLTRILALPLIIITMVVVASTFFLYENWKTQPSDLDHGRRPALSGQRLIVASALAVTIITPIFFFDSFGGMIGLPVVAASSTLFLYKNWKTQKSGPHHRKRSVLSGPLLIVASVIAASVFTIAYPSRYETIVTLPSAGCWLALITGSMMATPRSPSDRGTATAA